MATLISTTNVALSELETAPGGSTYSNMRFANLARPGWNESYLGSSAFANFTWGLDGTSSGADAIYGLTPTSGQFSLDQFKGLQYYFDGSPFDITYEFINNLNPPPGPFPPPNANDVTIEFVITDSALNYSIFGPPGNTPPNFFLSFGMPANTSSGSAQIPGFSPDQFPLVRDVYWIVRASCDVFFGGGALSIEINGTGVLNSGLSPGFNDFDYTVAGAASGLTNSTGIHLAFDVR
jgi:hypothetical protein